MTMLKEVTVCYEKVTEWDVEEGSAACDGTASHLLEEARSLYDEMIGSVSPVVASNDAIINLIKHHPRKGSCVMFEDYQSLHGCST